MVLINGEPISLILTAAVVGIGAGIGSALGQALYKAFLEDKVQKFLDKKHRAETLARIKRNIVSLRNTNIDSESVIDKMLKD